MRGILLLIALWAGLLFGWRTFIYEPPTHKIQLYEKAPGTRRLSRQVGPNLIKIRSVTRNRRDGSLLVEDGKGNSRSTTLVSNAAVLKNAADWLDIVQIELEPGPDLLDILQVRIFDHETRTILGSMNPNAGWVGWQVLKPNLLQIYGLGRELPPKLDVWLRFHSYDSKDAVVRLQPTKGSTCALPGGTLTLRDIRAGSWAYDSRKTPSYHLQHGNESAEVSTEIVWQGNNQEIDYQIAAISLKGEKANTASPHFLRFGSQSGWAEPISFHMPLEKIDHFELRPFGGRHRFFFEAVQLPAASGQPFANPPVATVPVGGVETSIKVDAFAPLTMRLSTYRGNLFNGSQSSGDWVSLSSRKGGATEVNEEFTLAYDTRGLGYVGLGFRFQDADTGQMHTEANFSPRSSGRAANATRVAEYKHFLKPLASVEAVEMTLQPKP